MAAAPIQANSSIYRSGEYISPNQILERLCNQYLTQDRVTLITEPTGLLPPLAKMVMEYVLENLPAAIFGWYTALTKLYTLAERRAILLPALPPNIVQTLLGPITAEEAKAFGVAEGTAVSQIYSLRLVHQGSLNKYEERLTRYREAHLGDPNAAAFQFKFIWPAAKAQHGNSNAEWGWALVSNDVLLESQGIAFVQQMEMLPSNCDLATFPIVCTSTFDHALTTGERLLKEGDETNNKKYTRTRVSETTQNYRVTVGNFASDGLSFRRSSDFDTIVDLGIVALRHWNEE